MTDLTTYTAPAPMADYQSRAVQRLGEWATSADAAYHVAQRLVESSFVPQAFRGKPVDATAAILAGSEVGLSPMSSLRAFDVIQGQAAPRAITLRAVVQSLGHEMVLVESTNTRCKMRGRRRGTDEWQTVTWTIDRARDLGLVGKDNWKKQPGAMLVARATSELARLIAADAILGIGYTSEEVADGTTGDAPEIAIVEQAAPAPTTGRRVLRRPQAPAGADAPDAADIATPPAEVDGAPVEDAEPTQTDSPPPPQDPDAITPAQLKKIGAGMRELGITERTDALGYVSRAVGREVGSRNELTKDEASMVIDALEFDSTVAGQQDEP